MKLLCATDLKPKSEAAVDRAYQLAHALNSSLTLVHVVPTVAADEGTLEQRLLSASSRMAQRARHAVARNTRRDDSQIVRDEDSQSARNDDSQREKGGDVRAELVVRCGRPANVVGEEAEHAALIVIGPHEPAAVDALRGTLSEKLLSDARCPVLVVRRPASEPYRQVLLAVDGSRATGAVVRAAERLPVAPDAGFAVVHAHEPPYEAMMNTVGVGNLSVASYASASMSQAATQIRAQLRIHSLDWRRYRVMLMDARPVAAIRQAMLETRPDLLVLGTRGHGRFRRALLGSTALEVLGSVDCDVLVVPEAMLRAVPRRADPPEDDPGPQAA